MEQSLQGVSFPKAAAAKAELMQHSHDPGEPPYSGNPWKRRGMARPWMGWGVGDGKETVILQDQMMKRKRDGGAAASTASVTSAAVSESTPKSGEKFELDFLRHDGHFISEPSQKKGPVCTFVKQYFREKWHENTREAQPLSKSTNRLEYTRGEQGAQAMGNRKQLEYPTARPGPQPGRKGNRLVNAASKKKPQGESKSERLEFPTAREDSQAKSMDKRLEYTREYTVGRVETQPVIEVARYVGTREETTPARPKNVEHTTSREETQSVTKTPRLEHALTTTTTETLPAATGKGLKYATTTMEAIQLVTKSKGWEDAATIEETKPVSRSKKLEYATMMEEMQPVTNSTTLDFTTTIGETQQESKTKKFEYAPTTTMKQRQTGRRRRSLEYPPLREEAQPVSISRILDYATADEANTISMSSDYAQTEEVEAERGDGTSPDTKPGLPCGTDCNQVRTEIFRKTNRLIRRKPEVLHIKARPKKHSASSDEDDEIGVTAREHQGVQTVFTENKKVQTSSHEPKQVQWAILPKDTLSPKMPRLVNEFQKPATKMQYFRDDSVLMKVSMEPTSKTPIKAAFFGEIMEGYSGRGGPEVPVKDAIHFHGEIMEHCGRKGIVSPKDTLQQQYSHVEMENHAGKEVESQADSPFLSTRGKRTKAPHHLLLYQEAMEIAKEQRELERAREQRRDFWTVYERQLKRGRGRNVEEAKTERKGKWILCEEEETPDDVSMGPVVKTKFNAFVDEHLSLGSTTPVSSSTRDGSGCSQEAAAIFKQLLDKVESYETSPKGDHDLVGLQGLRKIQAVDNERSLEAMEQQLHPETIQPSSNAQLSPTELDCMKAAILSHSFYPRLVTSFINQHKAGAPPDQVERLEKIRTQVMESWRPASSPVSKPSHEDKIKKYQDILTKFERELEKPFQDAMDFSWHMEHYLGTIPESRGRSEIGSSGSINLKDFDGEQ